MRRKRENELALERVATLLQLRLAMRESASQAEDEAVEADLVAQMRQTAEALKTSPVCATSGGQWRPMLSATKTPLDLGELVIYCSLIYVNFASTTLDKQFFL